MIFNVTVFFFLIFKLHKKSGNPLLRVCVCVNEWYESVRLPKISITEKLKADQKSRKIVLDAILCPEKKL
jgi:hypothetical protein